jgi:hypothetical protein
MELRLVAVLSALVTSACASVNVTPPAEPNIERSRQLAMPFERAWLRVVDWIATNNITIEKIEKPSGLITAKYAFSVDESVLDSGEISMSGVLADPKIDRIATLNVTIRETPSGSNQATANFFGEFHAVGQDSWDARPVVAEGRCVSTGVIEQQFLDYMSA